METLKDYTKIVNKFGDEMIDFGVESNQKRSNGPVEVDKGTTLSEKDLHCLARILQGCLYMEGDMFCCCRYCIYQEKCNRDAKEGKTYFTETVSVNLQKVTGVYLGINTHNLEDKLLVNSFQPTNRHGNMQ